ncbi:hypothetical protein SDC9_109470 [bioreactor metagenome]|uniref:Uncharacterized protein n=1 Tax=bioreactor metagenome TaxID=1076179 RepID=A0A645BLA5_9ZZZZ
MGKVPSNHALDDGSCRKLVCRPGAHILAIAHDGDFVADLQDLFHLMGNIDDGHTSCLQRANDGEQMLHLILRQRGTWLIHNDDF